MSQTDFGTVGTGWRQTDAGPAAVPYPLRVAVFVSGGGTNFQRLIDASAAGVLGAAELVTAVASRPGIRAIERAEAAGIPVAVVQRGDFEDQAGYDAALLDYLAPFQVDLVVLAGFLTRLGPGFIRHYPNRIINIHPSLLPAFGGAGYYGIRPHEAVLAAGLRETGATVHLVDESYDTGRILMQKTVAVLPADSPEILQQRVMTEAEQIILPAVVRQFADAHAAGTPISDGQAVQHPAPGKQSDERQTARGRAKGGSGMIQRALISVSDKTGLEALGRGLTALGVEILSTGGTAAALRQADIAVTDVSEVTGFPECLDGRVKTLHPRVHAGILAERGKPDHMAFLAEADITPIDLVVVNLYPFRETIQKSGVSFETCVENIDIGGPSMVRAAAKNFEAVAVVTDPADYPAVLDALQRDGAFSRLMRYGWMVKAFEHTAAYDAMVAAFMRDHFNAEAAEMGGEPVPFPQTVSRTWQLSQVMRYGENPHQAAAFYKDPIVPDRSLAAAQQLQGKALSYNNIADADAAIALVQHFDRAACVAVKHANPCGVAVRDTADDAWRAAYDADPVSVFGGIVALNRPVSLAAAEHMAGVFLEVIIAPDFEPDALDCLSRKSNLRLLKLPALLTAAEPAGQTFKAVRGGLLLQDQDATVYEPANVRVVTAVQPDSAALADAYFGMTVVKYTKSNAIVLVKDGATVGIGPGQVNRITALEIAIRMAGDKAAGSVLASDAYFPFDDCVRRAASAGIRTIVQPGGSIRDEDSIRACDEMGISMMMTGQRHFLH